MLRYIVSRYIVSGAPGAGKTTILAVLRARGYPVVDEAATDLIARVHAAGRAEPWRDRDFADAIARLQRDRQQQPAPAGSTIQLYDRSQICTLALARYLGQPVSRHLANEVDRVVRDGIYQRRVFFVQLLGFVTPTAARRISHAQSVGFERLHREAYLEHGYELVDVPVAPIEQRADLIEKYIRSWAGLDAAPPGPVSR
jgi:predicted ATPase